jgi:hypothetical protein
LLVDFDAPVSVAVRYISYVVHELAKL